MEALREALLEQHRKQQEIYYTQQQDLVKQLSTLFLTSSASQNIQAKDSLANSISEFHYDPESGSTFDAWFDRYRGLFSKDAQNLDDASKNKLSNKKPSTPWWFCGNLHYSKDCTYKSHKCQKCKTVGYKDGYCASSKKVKITLQLNTGSDLTIICSQTWSALGKPTGIVTSHIARDASSNSILFYQEFSCFVSFKEITKRLRCFVSSNPELNVMGLDWITAFNLWNQSFNDFCHLTKSEDTQFDINKYQHKFQDVFASGLGRCIKTKVKLHLKSDAKPVFKPKRPVAFAILPQVDAEVDRLEQNGIISPIKYSEICADFSTGLNESLETNRHPLPLPDEIFAQLANYKYFTHLDLSDAFLQVEIDDDSKKLFTINTHRGLYVYNRMPFGVTVAPGEFQAIMDSLISGLSNTFAYIDDLVVGGETVLEHNRNLTRLLERIQEYGFRLRLEKCNFFINKITYLGYVIDGQGLHPDPKKISAIIDMPAPRNLTALRSFLGAIHYYSRYISNMHILRRPLDHLLKKDVPWEWSPRCQKSFVQFKRILTSKLLLTHYNPRHEIIVATDASNEGLGACILYHFLDFFF
ncbi:uncharacterized protein K02A2.6-like [Pseudomyrmex gracilis]|uniref:uncharacterized protein K02A2.6-like n=1 Tax=Pseudomyrmex gracilis TaxID=219809 RepID=UPI0009948E8B|nr:uncharacterized protein K02A2.6-like [Pseudomyrmex gracilis]